MIDFILMSSKVLPIRPVPIDKELFCRSCGRFATGITVATVLGTDGEPHGMTANSFTSVSLAPPLVLICVDHRARLLHHLRRSEHFGLNVLTDRQRALSVHFARSGRDRFDTIPWYPGETGVPLLPDVLATIECGIHRMLEAGDHTVVIGEVLHARCHEGQPLLYFGSAYRKLSAEE
jgi:flavin reductase (DIM6/NTAB) family NADH-FMN oxidoreductase RutF